MNNLIEIRQAELKDAESLLSLIDFWYKQYFTGNRDMGHLYSKNQYTLEVVKKFITESEVAVAVYEGTVVSFYLINHFYEIGNIQARKNILHGMINTKLPAGRYAFALAAATDLNHTGQGLNKKCLNLLKELSKDKYDYFIGIMDYDNVTTQTSSLKMGWKHFGDIGKGLLAVIGTTPDADEQLILKMNEYAL